MDNNHFNIKIYESIDSTNCEAKRLALEGTPATWILGLNQTNGRARGKKIWHSASKNFTSSLLFYPKIDESKIAFYSFVAGLAVYDCLIKIGINSNQICLKWPNDVLLNKKKIGGILLECVSLNSSEKKALIVGFGLNLVSCPDQTMLGDDALPADYVNNYVKQVPNSKEFLKILIQAFTKWSDLLLNREFSRISDAFLKRSIPIGTAIKIKTVNNSTIGSFFGLNEHGSLILKCSSGLIEVSAGDVALVGN